MPAALTSKRHVVADIGDAIEFCFQQGWSDGLPVVPPTADRVRAMLEMARLDHPAVRGTWAFIYMDEGVVFKR